MQTHTHPTIICPTGQQTLHNILWTFCFSHPKSHNTLALQSLTHDVLKTHYFWCSVYVRRQFLLSGNVILFFSDNRLVVLNPNMKQSFCVVWLYFKSMQTSTFAVVSGQTSGGSEMLRRARRPQRLSLFFLLDCRDEGTTQRQEGK